MIVSLIWAMAENNVIGIENRLPWKLPADMQWFRQNTMGKPIIMGRLTFESFGAKALPGRRNIIISRDTDYRSGENTDDIEVYNSLEAALDATKGVEEVMIIGGMSLYKQALSMADRLYMTLVHAELEGDAWFPEFDIKRWDQTERSNYEADEKNSYPYSFVVFNRKQ